MEISVIGKLLFIADLLIFSDFKNFNFKGPKSGVAISKKQGTLYFFQSIFLVGTNAKNPKYMVLNQNLIKIRFLKS